MLPSRLLQERNCKKVRPSVSKVAEIREDFFFCVESVMLWRGIMGFTKFGDKRANDLDLLSGYVVGVSCLHRRNPCRRIFMQLVSPLSWWSVLYLSFLFAMLCSSSFSFVLIRTSPCADYFSELFFGDTKCKKPRHTLKTSLRCAFYWESHDHTFDLLCFNMLKTPLGLRGRPEIETKNEFCQKRPKLFKKKQMSRSKKNSSECAGLPFYSFHWGMSTFLGETSYVLCLHLYKLHA